MGKRIWQYPEATGITNSDVILIDSPTEGSRSIKANEIGSVLINKTITERGTYDAADDNVDGYKKVTVDVPYTDVEVASGPIASWDDGEDLPLKSLTSFIEPQQEGSGDPSPENVRPLSGWDKVNVTICGKNLFSYDLPIRDGFWASATSFQGSNNIVQKENATGWQYIRLYIEGLSQITLSGFDVQGGTLCAWLGSEDANDIISTFNSAEKNGTKIVPQGAKYLCLVIYSINTKAKSYPNAQLELGTTATAYEPYNGATYTIDLDGTRYGGTLDVVSGELVVTDGYIASYNGETLPSTWISDRDVYAEGSTPTTGAEVCYKLATPQTIQLTPTQVKSLVGENNIYSDTGDVDVEYQKIWVRPSA